MCKCFCVKKSFENCKMCPMSSECKKGKPKIILSNVWKFYLLLNCKLENCSCGQTF